MSLNVRRAVGVATVTGLAVVGAQLIGVVAAYAHSNSVTGSASCASNGTYTVRWTVSNDYNLNETATVTKHTPSGSAVSQSSFKIPSKGTHSLTQSGIPQGSTSATLSVHGLWSDKVTYDATGSVSLKGVCGGGTGGGTVPTAPTAANGACVNSRITQPSVTIPSQKNVSYTLDQTPARAGKHDVSVGTHVVRASSTEVKLTGKKYWSFTVQRFSGDCSGAETVTKPIKPTVTQSTCTGSGPSTPTVTLSHTKGITYSVTPSAPFRAGEKVTVTAVTKQGYQLGRVSSAWKQTSDHRATYTTTLDEAPQCSGTEGTGVHQTPVTTSSNGSASGGLAATGPKTGLTLAVGLGLLGLGAISLLGGRRRRTE